jgi:hypothetical protein
MANPLTTAPDLIGKSKSEAVNILTNGGLTVGAVKEVASDKVPVGNVISSSPAAGANVAPGAQVDIVVSTGSAGVRVPDVTGLTRFAADGTLRSAGLVLGTVSTGRSSAVPAGGVIEQSPPPGTPLPAGSRVDVQVSSGVERSLGDWVRMGVFSLLAIILLVGAIWGIMESDGGFLAGLADEKKARGLITFLIAVTTIGIAVILALSTVLLEDSSENDKRFDRGKQVLTILIGVLGTIVGFYFGAASNTQTPQVPPTAPAALTITTQTLPPGAAKQPYPSVSLAATGGTAPLTWSATGLPAGLTLDQKTGALTGTPLAAGITQVTVSVTDSSLPPRKADKQLQLEVK